MLACIPLTLGQVCDTVGDPVDKSEGKLSLSPTPYMLKCRRRIQREGQCEQAPEHRDVGLLDWAQHKIVGLSEEVYTDGVYSEIHEPLVFQEEAQDCGDRSLAMLQACLPQPHPPTHLPSPPHPAPLGRVASAAGAGSELGWVLPRASTAVRGQVASWKGASRGTDKGFSS